MMKRNGMVGLVVFKGVAVFLVLAMVVSLGGCVTGTLMERSRTVSVTGTGTVKVEPDTAAFSIAVSELGKTTKEAQSEANRKMDELLSAIYAAGILEKDVTTTSISFNPEYRWNEGEQILVGQRASQSLRVTVRNLQDNPDLLSSLIDAMGNVTNISMSSIAFSKADTVAEYDQSRRLAMEHAMAKAASYAVASNMVLGKPLQVSDYSSADSYAPAPRAMMAKADMMYESASYATELPTGEITISTTVSVVFELR